VQLLVLTLAFMAGSALIFGLNLFIADVVEAHRQQVRRRIEEDIRARQKDRARDSLAYKEMFELAAAGTIDLRYRRTLLGRLSRLVDESGLQVRSGQLFLISLGLGAMVLFPIGVVWAHWTTAAILTPVAVSLPVVYVAIARARRKEKLLSQLPDAFDLMSRTLRAGQTMSQALQAVADEYSPPIAVEFGYCHDQQNLGLSPEAAMRDLARRTGLLELKIFVLAVMIHRQTGGNLSELLQKLAMLIRQRYRIRGTIKSLTAEGRLQALILLALPPVMLVVMLVLNRPYAMVLFRYPGTLLAVVAMMMAGGLWMQRIVKFDF
jgi:tight adherence protein B